MLRTNEEFWEGTRWRHADSMRCLDLTSCHSFQRNPPLVLNETISSLILYHTPSSLSVAAWRCVRCIGNVRRIVTMLSLHENDGNERGLELEKTT